MKVFKFGGASIKNVEAIKNMASIINHYKTERLVVVVSAMGKSTNFLEEIIRLSWNNESCVKEVERFQIFHEEICSNLFNGVHAIVSSKLGMWIDELKSKAFEPDKSKGFSWYYDQIVGIGELISSEIISEYLNFSGLPARWQDARSVVKTTSVFQEGIVDWPLTTELIKSTVQPVLQSKHMVVTQGFIGSTHDGATTTLGREGSDYSAAIFACALEAENVTIWKDVPGILNADPKIINSATLFPELSYVEAAELTYYGAKVIHPKTIKPLANKNIPLHVRCFDAPEGGGTVIYDVHHAVHQPSIIYKENQCLVSLKVKDFTFVNEHNLHLIFHVLAEKNIKINLMQNSAISISVTFDYNQEKLEALVQELSGEFEIYFNTGLEMMTIKNYTDEVLKEFTPKSKLLLEQRSRSNYRVLYEKG